MSDRIGLARCRFERPFQVLKSSIRVSPIGAIPSTETAMKKLFRLIILLRGAASLLARGRARRHAYYPLHSDRQPSLAERLLRRFSSRAGR